MSKFITITASTPIVTVAPAEHIGPRHAKFAELLKRVPPGPRIEFGVLFGTTLLKIADHHDLTIGVDSFEGFAEPGEFDKNPDGSADFGKGTFRADYKKVAATVADNSRIILMKGWVPEIMAKLPQIKFAFAHCDLDHYLPTKAAIEWLWTRMLPSGILACDDWVPDKSDILAAKAIKEVARERRGFDGAYDRQCYWKF